MSGSDVVSVRVPFRAVRRGGRKVIVVPDSAVPVPVSPAEQEVDTVLLRAIVRAWRWRRDIEDGRVASITETAERESLTDSFVGRMLTLTTLAPELLRSVLDERSMSALSLQNASRPLPVLWVDQHEVLAKHSRWSSSKQAKSPASGIWSRSRATAPVVQRKTGRVVPFEVTEQTIGTIVCRPGRHLNRADCVEKLCRGTQAIYGLWSLHEGHAIRSGSIPSEEASGEFFNSIRQKQTFGDAAGQS